MKALYEIMKNKNKLTKIFLILVFATILLIGSVSAFGDYKRISYQTNYNSYNHMNQNSEYSNDYYSSGMSRVKNPQRTSYLNKHDNSYYSYENRPVRANYRQHAVQKTKKDFLGSYVKDYSVSITNKERTGKYYTVQFNFVDKNGYRYTESMTQYLKDGERKKFDYKDIQFERHEILDWDYRIIQENY